MNTHMISVISIVLLLFSACMNREYESRAASATSGESTGTRGGGKGVLCTYEDGMQKIESLDRFEAIHELKYSVPLSQAYDSEKDRIVEKLLDGFRGSPMKRNGYPTNEEPEDRAANKRQVLGTISDIEARLQFIPVGARLDPVDDAGKMGNLPDHCGLIQVVSFLDEAGGELAGIILVDRQYWSLLAPQDQIAFLMHEWIYRALRNSKELTSERVRKMVGRLISSHPYPSKYEALFHAPEALRCLAIGGDGSKDGLDFYVIPANGGSALVFSTLLSKNALAPVTARSSISYENWKAGKVNFSESLFLESFLGNYHALLSVQSYPSTKPDYLGASPSHWAIRFEENGKPAKAIRFGCEVVFRK